MTETAAREPGQRWKESTSSVRAAVEYVQQQGSVSAAQMVAWDKAHGRQLFTWSNREAAEEFRLHEARQFLNHFVTKFNGLRIRAFPYVREDAKAGIVRSGYVPVRTVVEHPGMRNQVIEDTLRRMESLAAMLKFYQLTPDERADAIARMEQAWTWSEPVAPRRSGGSGTVGAAAP